MSFYDYDPGDRNNWYQSPQLGLFPAGYGSGISDNYYCAWANHLHGNPYSQAQMVTNFTQPNPYPPPPHNPSATIINGHLLPHQFPCVPQTHSHFTPPPHLQPIHPIAPPSPIIALSEGQVFDPPSPQPLTFVPQPQFPDPKPPSCFRLVGNCEPLALFTGRIQTTPSSSSLSFDPHTYLVEATNLSSPPLIFGVPEQIKVLHSKLAVSALMEELQKPHQSLCVAVAEEGNLATQVDFASPSRNRDEKLKRDDVVSKGVDLAVLEALKKGATPETLDPRTVKRLVLAVEPAQSFTSQPQQPLNQHHMDKFVTPPPLAQFTARLPPLLDDAVSAQPNDNLASFCWVRDTSTTVSNPFNFLNDDCNGMGFVFDADGIDEQLDNGKSVEKRAEVNSGDGREFSEPERVIGKQDEGEDEEQLSNGMSEFHALQLFDKMPKLDGFDDMENDVKQLIFEAALVSARMYNEWHEPHKEFAVDLEHNQYRPFQGLTCLMQISTSTEDFIVDTLKLRIHIGPYLREVFKDPPKRKVMHGGRDIVWFQRAFGIYSCNLFYTGQASRVLKLERNSLDYLLHHFCDVSANKEYQNTNRSPVGNSILYSEVHTSTGFGNRFLNDNLGEENVFVGDSFRKMQINSERVLELILGKWKSRVTAKTQSEAKLVQWFILCLQLCHCETKEIILFCKEAFDGIGEMTQTSLSQVFTTLNLNDQDVRRAFESFLSAMIKLYNHSFLNSKVEVEIWPPDGEWLDLDGEMYCRVVRGFLDNKNVKELAVLIIKAQKLESSTIVVDRSCCCSLIIVCAHELQTAKGTRESHCLELEVNAKEAKLELQRKLNKLESLLTGLEKNENELEASLESVSGKWKHKQGSFQSFVDYQAGALTELNAALQSTRLEILSAKQSHSEEFNCMGSKPGGLADAAEKYRVVLAEKVFVRIPEVSVVSWNVMITGYILIFQSQKAIEYLPRIQTRGFGPDEVTYINLPAACVKAGDIKRSHQMSDNISRPNVMSVNAIISVYFQNEDHMEVIKLLREMLFRGLHLDQSTLAIALSSSALMGIFAWRTFPLSTFMILGALLISVSHAKMLEKCLGVDYFLQAATLQELVQELVGDGIPLVLPPNIQDNEEDGGLTVNNEDVRVDVVASKLVSSDQISLYKLLVYIMLLGLGCLMKALALLLGEYFEMWQAAPIASLKVVKFVRSTITKVMAQLVINVMNLLFRVVQNIIAVITYSAPLAAVQTLHDNHTSMEKFWVDVAHAEIGSSLYFSTITTGMRACLILGGQNC
ncbi:putative ribonuclease H-like domain-containing protein [Rosa chinensis]|uniref:Putative ribonuclease H-like domain-containing protein n=1 Tax=Rosa chinensis TaxID=74649 RepID=A0A2P6QX66_ROSCH|nr:putative ribonuclease H-like domain-containing protein [Rosa chinensis]